MQARDLHQIREEIKQERLTLTEIVAYYLRQIEQSKDHNIYIEVWAEEALVRAADLYKTHGTDIEQAGPLYGAVMSIKDVLCYRGHVASAGSKMLSNYEASYTSTAVQKAIDAGAVIIGRTNCDEFAMGSTNEYSHYGPTYNGADLSRVPGGSSGGAAVSVQMDTCLVALGTDTGGSVRQPAAFCGVYGFKPSYGRISRYGVIAYASSFDQIGVLAHSIDDVRSVYDVIKGQDPLDMTSASDDIDGNRGVSTDHNLKIAYLSNTFTYEGMEKDVLETSERFISGLREQGHQVSEVPFSLMDYIVPTYYILATAEASSNLSRYDGVRYGHRGEAVQDIKDLYITARSEGFGMEVKRRIMMGTFVLSVGYFDAYFQKAQQIRRMIMDEINKIYDQYDVILMPSTIDVAWKVGELKDDPVRLYLADIYTVMANLCGLPAVSIPLDRKEEEMPCGIQFMGPRYGDCDVLQVAKLMSQGQSR